MAQVERFNHLMRAHVTGPDCTRPGICPDSCCSIHIDIPRPLEEWYLDEGYLEPAGLLRRGPFGFQLAVDPVTIRCVLFDPVTRGCRVHFTGRKPPQCWVYPTGFEPGPRTCKAGHEWVFPHAPARAEAQALFRAYNARCLALGKEERERIAREVVARSSRGDLVNQLQDRAPATIAGYRIQARGVTLLPAEGRSLVLARLCREHPECQEEFLQCPRLCTPVAEELVATTLPRLAETVKRAPGTDTFTFRDLMDA